MTDFDVSHGLTDSDLSRTFRTFRMLGQGSVVLIYIFLGTSLTTKSRYLSVGLQYLDDASVEVGVAAAGADGSAEVDIARHCLLN